MPNIVRILSVIGLFIAIGASNASAQSGRGFVGVNAGYQASTTEFDDSFTFPRDQETGTSRVTYPIDAGVTFDVGGGYQVWRQLGVGVAFSRFTRDGPVTASSSIPHPFFFQQHRDVSGESDGISHEETGVHLQAQYSVPLSDRLVVTLMGGPSFLHVNQAVVIDINYSEEFPYDTATFTGVDTETKKGSKAGFNVGADVRWMFTRTIGAGALVRLTRATIDLDAGENRTVSVDAGGAQFAAGIRIGF
jgi:outer membrane protein with beta-barrel domain